MGKLNSEYFFILRKVNYIKKTKFKLRKTNLYIKKKIFILI